MITFRRPLDWRTLVRRSLVALMLWVVTLLAVFGEGYSFAFSALLSTAITVAIVALLLAAGEPEQQGRVIPGRRRRP